MEIIDETYNLQHPGNVFSIFFWAHEIYEGFQKCRVSLNHACSWDFPL